MNPNETATVADEIAGMEVLTAEVKAEEATSEEAEGATLTQEEEATAAATEEATEGATDETGDGGETKAPEKEEAETADEAKEAAAKAEESQRETDDLKQQVDYLTRAMKTLTETIAKQTPAEEAPKFEIEASDFVASDEAYDAAMQSKEGLNAVLNKAAQYGAVKAVEHAYTDLPKTVKSEVMQVVDNAIMIHMFFKENKDLRSIGDVKESYHVKVANVYRTLKEKYPAKADEELFGMLAPEVRKVHKIAATKQSGKLPVAPGFGKGVDRTKTTSPKEPSIADEIADMEKVQ